MGIFFYVFPSSVNLCSYCFVWSVYSSSLSTHFVAVAVRLPATVSSSVIIFYFNMLATVTCFSKGGVAAFHALWAKQLRIFTSVVLCATCMDACSLVYNLYGCI